MTAALKIILGIEIALGIFWTIAAAMAHGPGGLAVVGLFFIIYALFSAFFLFAAWVYWRYPDERRIAGWIISLPFVFWFTPMLIRSMSGGFMSQQQLLNVLLLLVGAALALCWFFPRRAAAFVPGFLVRSTLFNALILAGVVCGWLFLVFAAVYLANVPNTGPSDTDTGMALAYVVMFVAAYLVGLGVVSFGASTWAWLSLRGGFERTTHKLNIAQLVVAGPGVLLGILVAAWMVGQSHL